MLTYFASSSNQIYAVRASKPKTREAMAKSRVFGFILISTPALRLELRRRGTPVLQVTTDGKLSF